MFKLLLIVALFLCGCDRDTLPTSNEVVDPPYETDEFTVGEGSVRIVIGKYDTDAQIRFYTGREETLKLVASHGNATVEMLNGGFRIAGRQVLGPQQPAIEDASGSLDTEQKLNMLLEVCRIHGLIARGAE